MPLPPDQPVSAQVILVAADGRRPDGRTLITSETVQAFLPSAETASSVRAQFARLGFQTGPLVGNNFSITGPVSLFESVFKTSLKKSKTKGVQFANPGKTSDYELAPDRIPEILREHLVAITFTAPPDFGPTSFAG